MESILSEDRLTVREDFRQVAVVADVDVLVVGGGPAGLGAGLAAAREGASTLMVERNGFPGDVATAALMTIFLHHRERLSGLSREIVDALGGDRPDLPADRRGMGWRPGQEARHGCTAGPL